MTITRRVIALAVLAVAVFAWFGDRGQAAVGINKQINFQGKVVNTNGTNIANGTYNMQFKIYSGGDGVVGGGDETLLWTEPRLRNSSQGVTFTDGVFQVNLGAVSSLPGSVDFNSDTIWLSMEIGNTNVSCTPFSACSGDGEMSPMVRFTATPYSFNSDLLDGIDSAAFGQLSATQTWTGSQTLQPTTNISSLVVSQTSAGSPTADILKVTTANGINNVIQVTGPAANESAIVMTSFGSGRDITLNSADQVILSAGTTIELQDNTNVTGTLGVSSNMIASNLGVEFTDSDTNPSCAAGEYKIYADTSEAKLKKCQNGTASDLASAAGGGITAVGTINSQTKSANGAVISGSDLVMQTADASFPGLVSTGTQTFAGDKTFNGALTIGTSDATGTLLTLDTKTGAGDPTGNDGAMYYNSDSKNFRCRHNGLWQDCDFASLRSEWVLQEDFPNTLVTTNNIGLYGWTLTDTSTSTEAKVNAATDASNRDRFGIYQVTTAATAGGGNALKLDANSMAGTPSNMVLEFDFGPSNAAAADGTQTVTRIGLTAGTTTSADPTDGIYFEYNATTTAGNWSRCTQNNNTVSCVDTGVARTTTLNTYQRFRIQVNSAGTSVEFFINEASVGSNSGASLPASTRPLSPSILMHTASATVRAWKIDYFQIKRNLNTLR